eukprot:CAMPEP_0118666010 /NCGR_PEP_ID=MMETSP0785-20121206/18966_1 /TAXON_ID=91992 /ORGANISM="Bolidomonas pacifica, Strain CCMP 1866" /LENGTH=4927 /DNA_ID=CAMNT_0006560251 /DNA_START=40 /DNA_END=14819 /DNA_ORIENTATION=-
MTELYNKNSQNWNALMSNGDFAVPATDTVLGCSDGDCSSSSFFAAVAVIICGAMYEVGKVFFRSLPEKSVKETREMSMSTTEKTPSKFSTSTTSKMGMGPSAASSSTKARILQVLSTLMLPHLVSCSGQWKVWDDVMAYNYDQYSNGGPGKSCTDTCNQHGMFCNTESMVKGASIGSSSALRTLLDQMIADLNWQGSSDPNCNWPDGSKNKCDIVVNGGHTGRHTEHGTVSPIIWTNGMFFPLDNTQFTCDQTWEGGTRLCYCFTSELATMTELYNKVSDGGNARMSNDDTVVLSTETVFRCSDGDCFEEAGGSMIKTQNQYGEIKCHTDDASCILDGEGARNIWLVVGTGGNTLTIRAMTFKDGKYTSGGAGIFVYAGGEGRVDLTLCVFTDNWSTETSWGGAGVYGQNSGTTINLFGARFFGNIADIGTGEDIQQDCSGGCSSITVHDTCPNSVAPTQGTALKTLGTISGSAYSYYCYHICPAGQYNPMLGDSASSCLACPAGKTSDEGSTVCLIDGWLVTTMTDVFDKVSNYFQVGTNTGASIMSNGETTFMGAGEYKCTEGTCALTGHMMLWLCDLYGSIECTNDSADCVLDAQSSRRAIAVDGTGGAILTLRALTFQNGLQSYGGGALIRLGSMIDIKLCVFINCRATDNNLHPGGGAIWLQTSSTTVNFYATRFSGNIAVSGNGNDIYNDKNEATITVHDTCPSPYSSRTSTQGSALDISGTIGGSSFTYFCYHVCPGGQYNPTLGDDPTACASCGAGEYSGPGSISCALCPAGKHVSDATTSIESSACINCASGKYSGPSSDTCTACAGGKILTKSDTSVESSACTSCATGEHSGPASVSCSACAAGTFITNPAVSSASSACTPCTGGSYSATSSTTCMDCSAGKSLAVAATGDESIACSPCIEGSYTSEAGMTSCSTCALGKIATSPGSTGCTNCTVGRYLNDDATSPSKHDSSEDCLVCGSGKYSDSGGSLECTSCSAGKFLEDDATDEAQHTGSENCLVCPSGKHSPNAASSTCSPCPAGKYQDSSGRATCSDCAPGHYSGSSSSICTACPVGTSLTNAATPLEDSACTTCGSGKYAATEAATVCTSCDAGKFLADSGTSASLHASSSLCEVCPSGTHSEESSGACSPCPAGSFLVDDGMDAALHDASSDCAVCATGKFSSSGSGSCSKCAAGKFMTPSDSPADHASSELCLTCNEGHYSPSGSGACLECAAGKYLPENNTQPASFHSSEYNCRVCQTGKHSGEGSEICTDCVAGTYLVNPADSDASKACQVCGSGRYSESGSTMCTSCDAGKFLPSSSSPTDHGGEGKCQSCPPGRYGSAPASDDCTNCSLGTYNDASGSTSCLSCPEGKTTMNVGASMTTKCVPDSREWDFRGCTTGAPVADRAAGELMATPINGPTCSADGIKFDGVDDYVKIDDWEWGGTTSFEVYVKYDSFNYYSRIFDFGNGADSDNVILYNADTSSTIRWNVCQGSSQKILDTSNYDSATWTHVVVTVNDMTTKVYKNGVLVDTKTDGHEPNVMTRTNHFIGASNSLYNFFDGTVAYLKMWHGIELTASDVTSLYAPHNNAHHIWDFRDCTTGAPVADRTAGDLMATPINGPTCSADGIQFDGVDDYVDIDDWEWGGSLSIELYVKYNSFKTLSPILDFGSGQNIDSLILGNLESSSTVSLEVFQDSNSKMMSASNFDSATWTHIVVTISGTTAKIYKNGILSGEASDLQEPRVLTRSGHYLGRREGHCLCDVGTTFVDSRPITGTGWEGRSCNDFELNWACAAMADPDNESHDGALYLRTFCCDVVTDPTPPYFDGTLMYLKMWHNTVLQQHDIDNLFLDPCKVGSGYSTGSNSCELCRKGTFSNVDSPEACFECPVGKWSDSVGAVSEDTCQSCAVGKSSASTAATSLDTCLPCPVGSFAGSTGMSTCEICDAGTFSQVGSNSCTTCSTGKWSDANSETCELCPKGKFIADDGETPSSHATPHACTICFAGSVAENSGSGECTLCDTGRYNGDNSLNETMHDSPDDCLECSVGTYTSTTGSSSCKQCERGKFLASVAGTECLSCPDGQHSGTGKTSCEACAKGKYLRNAATAIESEACEICGSGTFTSTESSVTCENCMAGTFLSDSAMSAEKHDNPDDCEICEAGLFSDPGSGACTPCPLGSHLQDDAMTASLHSYSSACIVCAAGAYSPSVGSAECDPCPAGTFLSDSGIEIDLHDSVDDCNICGSGHYSITGAASCTTCNAGKYQNGTSTSDHDSEDDCKDCVPGKISDAGSSQCSPCSAGSYAERASSSCESCDLGTYSEESSSKCDHCPRGTYSNTTGTVECTTCHPGYYNNATGSKSIASCKPCVEGTYAPSYGNGTCLLCPIGSYNGDKGKADCLPCAHGYYNDVEGATICKQCDANHHTKFTGAVAYHECLGPPMARAVSVVNATQHDAHVKLTMDQEGTGLCALHAVTSGPLVAPTVPTLNYLEANGQMINFNNNEVVTLRFSNLPSSSTFDIFCKYTSQIYSDGRMVSGNITKVGGLTTAIGYAGYAESPCARVVNNNYVTISLAAKYNEGRAWVLFLESPVDTVPTGNEIKFRGAAVHDSLKVDETGNAWLGSEKSFCLNGENGAEDQKEARASFVVLHTQTNLRPLTEYNIFIHTEDMEVPAEALPMSYAVADFPRTVQTTCCGFISVESHDLPSDSALAFQTYRAMAADTVPINFELSHLPGKDLVVRIEAQFYEVSSTAEASDCSTTLVDDRVAQGVVEILDTSNIIFPNTIPFGPSLASTEGSFVLHFKKAGCVILTLSATGEGAQEYGSEEIQSTKNRVAVTVIRDDAEPEPPTLKRAVFADTAKSLFVVFKSPTDKAVRTVPSSTSFFPCSDVFSIPSCPRTSCVCSFINATTVKVTLDESATTELDSIVSLLPGKVYAECSKPEVFNCESWTPAPQSTALVESPSVPLYPIPALSGAETVSSCSDITVSATSSSGSGGRAWEGFTWNYVSTATNQTAISAFINSVNGEIQAVMLPEDGSRVSVAEFNRFLTLVVPNSVLVQDSTYSFTLSLTNFFQNTASSTLSVDVSRNSVPTISIEGGNVRSMLRPAALSIFAEAFGASCPGEPPKIVPGKNYAWTIKDAESDEDIVGVVSNSIDRRYFKLLPYTLAPSRSYHVEVTVTDSVGLTASTSVLVKVGVSKLVAVIEGGSKVVSPKSKDVKLSAASSFDPDNLEQRGVTAPIFSWACMETSPMYGSPCGTDTVNTGGAELTLTESRMLAMLDGSTAKTLSFTVTYSQDARVSTASSFLIIESAEPPVVEIVPILTAKANPSNKLQIKGYLTPDSRYPVKAGWDLSSEVAFATKGGGTSTSLSEVASSEIEASLKVAEDDFSERQQFFLIIPAHTLIGGLTNVFRLNAAFDNPSASSPMSSGFAELTVEVNSPPVVGVLQVDNGEGGNTGDALQTLFSLTAFDFSDDVMDLPLQYSYLYTIGKREWGGTEVLVSANLLSSQVNDVILPNGAGNKSVVEVFTRVSDVYGASSEASTDVFVRTPKISTEELANLTDSLTSAALEKGDISAVFQVISSSASILNSLNCTLAPECASLNRKECSEGKTPNTCGICLEGFVSNDELRVERCEPPADQCNNDLQDEGETDVDCGGSRCKACATGQTCISNGDCSYGLCKEGFCSLPEKRCPGDCSGKGICFAYDLNLEKIDRSVCLAGSVGCRTSCVCDKGRFGRACDKTEEEQKQLLEQRKSMLQTLEKVLDMQDLTPEAASQQASNIESLVSNVEELDSDARGTASKIMTSVSEGLLENGGVDESTAKSLGESVSSLMTPQIGNSSDVGGRDGGAASFANVSNVVDNLLNAQILGQFVGEAPTEMITQNLKSSISKVSLSKIEGSTFSTPVSRQALETNYRPPLVALTGISDMYDEDCSVGVSIAELGAHQRKDPTAIDTSVTRFGLGCFSTKKSANALRARKTGRRAEERGGRILENKSTSKMLITLQNSAYQANGPTPNEEKVNVKPVHPGNVSLTCDWGFIGNQTVFCPNSTTPHTRFCAGEGRTWVIPCQDEIVYETPTCGLSSHLGPWSDNSCTVVEVNHENITCLCDILGSATESGGGGAGGGEVRRERRRRLIVNNDVDVGETSSIDVVGLVGSATRSFIATWEVAARLDADIIAKNIFVFYVMGSVLVLTSVLCIVGYTLDRKEKRKQKELELSSSSEGQQAECRDRKSTLLEESAPEFSQYVYKKMEFAKEQLSSRHPYLEVIFVHDNRKSRPQRVALLITSFLTILFVEAILYKYSYPDDPPGCVSYTEQVDCETPKSYWDTNRNRCLWTEEKRSCSFIDPEVTFVGSLVMSTLAIIVSAFPIMFLVIVFNATIFPKVRKRRKKGFGNLESMSSRLSEVNEGGEGQEEDDDDKEGQPGLGEGEESENVRIRKRDMLKEGLSMLELETGLSGHLKKMKRRRKMKLKIKETMKAIFERADEEYRNLEREEKDLLEEVQHGAMSNRLEEIHTQLKQISLAKIKVEKMFRVNGIFARIFGYDSRTKLLHKVTRDLKIAQAIEDDIKNLTGKNKELRLLEHARMMHLTLFEQRIYMQNRLEFDDEGEQMKIHWARKVFGYTLLTIYTLATSFYICLFGITMGNNMTKSWLMSFLMADLSDIFWFIPLKILILNIYLPTLIGKHVSQSISKLTKVKHWYGSLVNENATVYVAQNHPELDASELVLEAFAHSEAGGAKASDVAVVLREEGRGKGRPSRKEGRRKRQSIWNPGVVGKSADNSSSLGKSTSFMLEEADESAFEYKGIRKVGVFIFYGFVMMPSAVQDLVLDFLIPLLSGTVVYGNVLIYEAKADKGDNFPGLIEIAVIISLTCAYCCIRRIRKRRRHKKRLRKAASSNLGGKHEGQPGLHGTNIGGDPETFQFEMGELANRQGRSLSKQATALGGEVVSKHEKIR